MLPHSKPASFSYAESMARHDAFWDQTRAGGAGMMLQYPKDDQVSFHDLARPWMTPNITSSYAIWNQEAVWARAFDAWWHSGSDEILDQALAVQERYLDNCLYADLGFPYARPDLGPVAVAGIIAGDCHHTGQSMWYDRHPGWELSRIRAACATALDGAYFKAVVRSSQYFFDRLAGQALLTIPDLGEPMDVLAALRGATELTLDLVDHPEEIEETLAAINSVRWQVYDDLSARAAKANAGRGWTETMRFASSSPVWCSACDTAALFSPAMFKRFVLPTVKDEAKRFRLAWHLDGPAMPRHLDALFTIPELKIVQWVPGAGKPSGTDPVWDDLYRRISASGRRIGVCVGDSEGLEGLLTRHRPESFYIWAFPNTRAEGERLLDIARKHRTAIS